MRHVRQQARHVETHVVQASAAVREFFALDGDHFVRIAVFEVNGGEDTGCRDSVPGLIAATLSIFGRLHGIPFTEA